MNILIVEDDGFKYSEIEKLINIEAPSATLQRAENIRDTVMLLNRNSDFPDKIFLDMSLPTHTAKAGEGNPLSMPNGGVEVILELRSLNLNYIPIIILTQYRDIEIEAEYFPFPEARTQLRTLYESNIFTITHYDSENSEWKEDAKRFLKT